MYALSWKAPRVMEWIAFTKPVPAFDELLLIKVEAVGI
jgi:hypothetical protein